MPKETNPNRRRVYVKERIVRARAEMEGLEKELRDAQSAASAGTRDPQTNKVKIYARERLAELRDELKSLRDERKAFKDAAVSPEPEDS
jgi:predicted  nucleic acid-binding Zn-ribbon protein